MLIHFYKYHGTGNDFILLDNRDKRFDNLNRNQIKVLCSRRFGIGADGLMLLKSHPDFDFEMAYYNADGSGGTMCGNGGRCITAFAKKLGIINSKTKFIASDGPHDAVIEKDGNVRLKMLDVSVYDQQDEFSFINTGSPHYIKFVNNVAEVNVYEAGKAIRYSEQFQKEGTNVNFVSSEKEGISVRTYERGVEDETYSCGTGSVASAIAYYLKNNLDNTEISVNTLGGKLTISFNENNKRFTEVYLEGPAEFVFEGDIDLLSGTSL